VHGLTGWLALFEANIIDSDEGRAMMRAIVEAEATLQARKRELQPRHINERGESEVATLSMLSTNQATNPVEERRRSSFEGLREIERWVLDNGFLDVVKLRNRLARALGCENYFELKLRKSAGRTAQAFSTTSWPGRGRQCAQPGGAPGHAASRRSSLNSLFASGDVVRRMDAYMPFGFASDAGCTASAAWAFSIAAPRVAGLDGTPRQAPERLRHAPSPWVNDRGSGAGQINFTAEAKPDQVGSGLRAIITLFHEAPCRAFRNVVQNAPCFSQEYAHVDGLRGDAINVLR
jgi:hypothetical protein